MNKGFGVRQRELKSQYWHLLVIWDSKLTSLNLLHRLSDGNNYSTLLMQLLGSRKCNKLSKAPSGVLWYTANAQQIIIITMLQALCDKCRVGEESPEEE